jgi:pimeloyl-ACP methyl ester carboxylesterase
MYCEVGGNKTFYSNGNGHIDAAQPSIVFLHGAGMDHSVWVFPARYFARHGYNVYALDLPGHGRSEGELLTGITAMSDWLLAALEQLNVPSTSLVGHSMGSLIGLDFAARYPQHVDKLALLGTSTPMPVGPPLLEAARMDHHDAIDMVNTFSHSSAGQLGGSENPGMCMTMSGQRLLEQAGEQVLFTDLSACNGFTPEPTFLKNISASTLVIVGAQDKMTSPVKARQIADSISDAQIVTLNPCGHAMLTEQPNAVLDALAEMMRGQCAT